MYCLSPASLPRDAAPSAQAVLGAPGTIPLATPSPATQRPSHLLRGPEGAKRHVGGSDVIKYHAGFDTSLPLKRLFLIFIAIS